ncbi:DUF2834 domain-containing protein [Limimaricola pyoseonensis]|uniref:K+-transporting ATPase, A chain n=1 Tax=Limimaricola pyoseonensis TaxID=521013 RepID=A0A1G7JY02_9RHOB|nr:DUF2834 domain-containing protein [Limimaricola pyoseonensis]SDF29813.1 Protein of unknown function [Limimaricola pyoseonensis]
MRWFWLALAVWGALHPMRWSIAWFAQNGYSWDGLLAAWGANLATKALAWELVIAAITLIAWILVEVRVRRNWEALLAIPATALIGVGCGLPLFLFLRTRPI